MKTPKFDFLKKTATLGTVLLFSVVLAAAVVLIYYLTATNDAGFKENDKKFEKAITRDSSLIASQGVKIAEHEISITGQGNDLIRHDSIIIALEEEVIVLKSKVNSNGSQYSKLQNRVYNLEIDMGKLLLGKPTTNNQGPIITANPDPDDEEEVEEEEEEEEEEEIEE